MFRSRLNNVLQYENASITELHCLPVWCALGRRDSHPKKKMATEAIKQNHNKKREIRIRDYAANNQVNSGSTAAVASTVTVAAIFCMNWFK